MKIHNNKQEAEIAIRKFAHIVKEAHKETGADFLADADDDSGMEYYVEAAYRDAKNKIQYLKIHFQTLNL